MSNPYMGEIRPFGFNFAPRGWMLCRGQIMAISSNTALFSLLGTTYGGNGQNTFGLPDLQGRVPVGAGSGPGLSQYVLGEVTGQPTETLLISEIPSHTHSFQVSNAQANTNTAAGNLLARGNFDDGSNLGPEAAFIAATAAGPLTPLAAQAILPVGNGLPHENMMPFLTVNFCICVSGVYPARN